MDDSQVDWQRLARQVGLGDHQGSREGATRAISLLLPASVFRDAVDAYVAVRRRTGAELARSVLMLLKPAEGRRRCLEVYRSDAPVDVRRAAVELFRVVAQQDDLDHVTTFLADPDPDVQLWGFGVLKQLMLDEAIDDGSETVKALLTAGQTHPNPAVRSDATFLLDRHDE